MNKRSIRSDLWRCVAVTFIIYLYIKRGNNVIFSHARSFCNNFAFDVSRHPSLRLPRMRYIDITLYDIYIEPDLERRIKLSQEIIEIFRKMNGLIWIFFLYFLLLFFFLPFEGELLHFNVIVSYTRTQCCVFESNTLCSSR